MDYFMTVTAQWDGTDRFGAAQQVQFGRDVLLAEGRALLAMSARLDSAFCHAVKLLAQCEGSVIVSGMGKAGWIGQKISATLASTGTRSFFLHPAEAFHGDLGRVAPGDVALLLSQSGETDEIVRLLSSLAAFDIPVIAVTASAESSLGRAATALLPLGKLTEACWLGLAPSTSTTAMLALGDALALVVSRLRQFGAEDFARFHPGGSLGRKLSKVDDHMRPLSECRVASASATVREVFSRCMRPGRRTGAIMLQSPEGKLAGIFTDSDLARLFEQHREHELDRPVAELMVAQPWTIAGGSPIQAAVELMSEHKISELPVIAVDRRPLGLIDVTDIAGLLPADLAAELFSAGAHDDRPGPLRIAKSA